MERWEPIAHHFGLKKKDIKNKKTKLPEFEYKVVEKNCCLNSGKFRSWA